MTVWAPRTKLTIDDDLLRPNPVVRLKFAVSNPKKFYHAIPKIVTSVFRTDDHHIQEKKTSWSKGEPEKFKINWELMKEIDRFSFYAVDISLDGTSGKEGGDVSITVEGSLRTEYPQDMVWERSILYEMLRVFWHRNFYTEKRDKYMVEGRRMMAQLVEEVKRLAHEMGS